MKKLTWVMLALSAMMMSSCVVSRKKFEQSENARWRAYYTRDSLANLLDESRAQCAAFDQRCGMLMSDTALLKKSIRNYQSMLANNQSENKKLNSSLTQKIKELQEREQTIAQLQGMIDEQQRKVKELLASVKDALLGFSAEDLTVTEKDGKVYVSLSDKLLFESGKAVVNKQGKEALGKLAQVLNTQTEIDVYIEGHTDKVPIHTAVFKDNWDLSVIRATSVVRILTETSSLSTATKRLRDAPTTAVPRLSWHRNWTSCCGSCSPTDLCPISPTREPPTTKPAATPSATGFPDFIKAPHKSQTG